MLEQDYLYSRLAVPINSSDRFIGDQNAPLKIVAYSDYECPFSRQAFWAMKQLLASAGDGIFYVVRNFPLSQVHPHAQQAAEAAEIAALYGKFWEMHALLFENQQALDDKSLAQYAAALSIDRRAFVHDLMTHKLAPKVRADFLGGVRSGVAGAPTYFVNEVRFNGDCKDLAVAVLTEFQH